MCMSMYVSMVFQLHPNFISQFSKMNLTLSLLYFIIFKSVRCFALFFLQNERVSSAARQQCAPCNASDFLAIAFSIAGDTISSTVVSTFERYVCTICIAKKHNKFNVFVINYAKLSCNVRHRFTEFRQHDERFAKIDGFMTVI